MSVRVKGITIELKADTTGLEKALKDVNKSLSDTQKQLNSVNKSLELNPKNIELVEQKQRLLAQATEETKAKLDALKKAQDSLGKGNPATQSQYDALSREISDTTMKLQGLTTEQKNFAAEAQKAEFNSTAFGSALEQVGSKAEEVANKTAALSAAAAAALAALGGMVVSAARTADEWNTMSQQIGLSTETLQKFQYASSMIDVDMGTITSAITKMKGGLESNEEAWTRIGVNVRDQKGEYRDIESIFWDTVQAISNIDNETQRDTAAMEIFGKKANELAGILDDGGKKLQQLGNEAESLGYIIPQEDLDMLNQFNDELDRTKAQIQAAFVKLAVPVLQAMQPVLAKISEAIRAVANVVANLDPRLVQIIVIVLALIAAISPVARTIATITMAIQGLAAAIPLVSGALTTLNAALASLLANPVTWVILAIVAALALLGVAIYEVVTHWEEIQNAASNAMSNIKSAVSKGASAVRSFASSVKEKFAQVIDFFEQVKDAFPYVLEGIRTTVNKIIDKFAELADRAKNAGREMIQGLIDGVKSMIDGVINIFRSIANALKSIWSAITTDAMAAGSAAARGFSSMFSAGMRTVGTSTRGVLGRSRVSSAAFSEYGGGSLEAFGSSLTQALSDISTADKQPVPVNVTVELVGSAKNIFDTVRVENSRLAIATGYHALA